MPGRCAAGSTAVSSRAISPLPCRIIS
jgi:hypothetical protein